MQLITPFVPNLLKLCVSQHRFPVWFFSIGGVRLFLYPQRGFKGKKVSPLILHSFFQWDKMLYFYLKTIWTRKKKNSSLQGYKAPFFSPWQSQQSVRNQVTAAFMGRERWGTWGWMISHRLLNTNFNIGHAHTKQLGVKWANSSACLYHPAANSMKAKWMEILKI